MHPKAAHSARTPKTLARLIKRISLYGADGFGRDVEVEALADFDWRAGGGFDGLDCGDGIMVAAGRA